MGLGRDAPPVSTLDVGMARIDRGRRPLQPDTLLHGPPSSAPSLVPRGNITAQGGRILGFGPRHKVQGHSVPLG